MSRLHLWYKFILVGWMIFVGLSFIIAGIGYGWRLAFYSYFIHIDMSSVGETLFGIINKFIIYAPIISLPWALNRNNERL